MDGKVIVAKNLEASYVTNGARDKKTSVAHYDESPKWQYLGCDSSSPDYDYDHQITLKKRAPSRRTGMRYGPFRAQDEFVGFLVFLVTMREKRKRTIVAISKRKKVLQA